MLIVAGLIIVGGIIATIWFAWAFAAVITAYHSLAFSRLFLADQVPREEKQGEQVEPDRGRIIEIFKGGSNPAAARQDYLDTVAPLFFSVRVDGRKGDHSS